MDINKRKMEEKKRLQNQQDINRKFGDYNWFELFNNGFVEEAKSI